MYQVLIEPYKRTALRHLDMADTLLDARFHDGAAFHVYHAYESVVCAAILKRQPDEMPPLAHPTKLNNSIGRIEYWMGHFHPSIPPFIQH